MNIRPQRIPTAHAHMLYPHIHTQPHTITYTHIGLSPAPGAPPASSRAPAAPPPCPAWACAAGRAAATRRQYLSWRRQPAAAARLQALQLSRCQLVLLADAQAHRRAAGLLAGSAPQAGGSGCVQLGSCRCLSGGAQGAAHTAAAGRLQLQTLLEHLAAVFLFRGLEAPAPHPSRPSRPVGWRAPERGWPSGVWCAEAAAGSVLFETGGLTREPETAIACSMAHRQWQFRGGGSCRIAFVCYRAYCDQPHNTALFTKCTAMHAIVSLSSSDYVPC